MMKIFLFIVLLVGCQFAFAQKKDVAPKASTFNNKSNGHQYNNTGSGKQIINIQNPKNVFVTFHKKVDTSINYITPNDNKIYFLNRRYIYPILEKPSLEVMEFTFGNPDSNATRNINFRLDFDKAYDSAYTKIIGQDYDKPFDPFNKNSVVRDTRYLYSCNKKSITIQAGYLAAKSVIKLYVISTRNFNDRITSISITGAGKLF